MREKLRQRTMDQLAPLLAVILRQGAAEGAFTVISPTDASVVLISLMQGAQLVATQLLLDRYPHAISFAPVERTLQAISDAYEAMLVAPRGSLRMDRKMLRFGFDAVC